MNQNSTDILQAIDLVLEEIQNENNRILKEGGEEMIKGNTDVAEQAIAFAKKLKLFSDKVSQLKDEWTGLNAEIVASAPEVQEIVLPTTLRQHKTGYTRNVESVGPRTNFIVKFSDGTVIKADTAKKVFALAIEKIGSERVANLKILTCAEPLISKDKSVYIKKPSQIEKTSDGWYIRTHSSTSQKMSILKKIAVVLKLNFTCELI